MDAKEKALELYNKYEKIFVDANADSWGKEAKKCALIAIDEIIAITAPDCDKYEDYYKNLSENKTQVYWILVKEEISNI